MLMHLTRRLRKLNSQLRLVLIATVLTLCGLGPTANAEDWQPAWSTATLSVARRSLSATSAGVKDVREILAGAKQRLEIGERRTVLFLDEIHRFAKNQQDALLPGVEDGTLVLIGATTENPFFEIITPPMSRMTLFRLEPLAADDIGGLADLALADADRGLGGLQLALSSEAREELSLRTGGDARQALNALEVAALLTQGDDRKEIGLDDVAEALQRRIVRYDRAGDNHYDVISAFIKSVRGSDPDAALYWLFLMLEGGEDPEFIARRLVILASEDVNCARSPANGATSSASWRTPPSTRSPVTATRSGTSSLQRETRCSAKRRPRIGPMWRSLICTMRKPSSLRGQRRSRCSTRRSPGGRMAVITPTALAPRARPATVSARRRALTSSGPPCPESASALLPSRASTPSEATSRVSEKKRKPIQSNAGQATSRASGGFR